MDVSEVRGQSQEDVQKGGDEESRGHLGPLGLRPRSEPPDRLRAHPENMQVAVLLPEHLT